MNASSTSVITEEDQQSFNRLAAEFSGGKLADCVNEYEFPYALNPADLVCRVNELGFLSINLPAEYGGLGLTFQPLAGILEQISLTDAGLAGAVFANAAALEIISAASSSSECAGIYEIISQAGTLPLAFQSYSCPDEASVPRSVKKEGDYFLHGRADLLAFGNSASYSVIPAVGESGTYSYFLVNLTEREIIRSGPVLTIGMQSCRPADIEFNGVKGFLIGKEGEGLLLFEEVSRRMSYPACGIMLGIMKGSFSKALEYCAQRYQGGRMIIQWDNMRMKLAGMGTLVSMAETCVNGLKNLFASGSASAGPSAIAAAMHIGNMSAEVASDGIQLLGGNGYMKDYGQEKRMRDAKQAQCLLGSSPFRKKRFIDEVINELMETGN